MEVVYPPPGVLLFEPALLREHLRGIDAMVASIEPLTREILAASTLRVVARMGVGYEQLKEVRPDIIVLEMPAFGNSGPMAHYGALGPGMEFSSGMSSFVGYEGGGPMPTGSPVSPITSR